MRIFSGLRGQNSGFSVGSTRSDPDIFPGSKRSESNFFLPRSTGSDTEFFSPGSAQSQSGFRPLPPVYAVIIRTFFFFPGSTRSDPDPPPPYLRGPMRNFPPGLRGPMGISPPGLRGPMRIFPSGSPERRSAPRCGRNPVGAGTRLRRGPGWGRPAPPRARARDAVWEPEREAHAQRPGPGTPRSPSDAAPGPTQIQKN